MTSVPPALRRIQDRQTRYVEIRRDAYVELIRSKTGHAVCLTALDANGVPLDRSHVLTHKAPLTAFMGWLREAFPDLEPWELERLACRVASAW